MPGIQIDKARYGARTWALLEAFGQSVNLNFDVQRVIVVTCDSISEDMTHQEVSANRFVSAMMNGDVSFEG